MPGKTILAAVLIHLLSPVNAASITVSPSVLEFGNCGHNQTIRKEVTISNNGTESLRITRIRSSCSCTKCSMKQRRIAPGSSETLSVVLSTGRVMGMLHKYVEIHTDQPDQPPVKIPVNAGVHADVKAIPWSLPTFSASTGGPPVKQRLVLVNRRAASNEMVLKKLKAEDRHVTVKADPVKQAGKITRYDIEITITPSPKEGFFKSRLTAELNGKPWVFPVQGYIFDGIVVQPRYFQFGRIEKPAEAASSIMLESADSTPFEIIEISSAPDLFWFDIQPIAGGLKYKIDAHIRAEDRSKRFFATVTILTTHPDKRKLTVKCLGFWANPKK